MSSLLTIKGGKIMLKFSKSITAALIASLMLITGFTGCSKSGTSPNSTPSDTTATADNGPKPTLKVLYQYMKDDFNTYPSAIALEQKTGYKVQYDMLPQDKPDDKLNLIVASGEQYDFIRIMNKSRYVDYSKQGALVELEPLIAKYGPNISKNITKLSFDGLRVDGKYYGIPNINPSATGRANLGAALAIRQDWLDKLGMKVPTTLDEFKAVLEAFKEKDPGANGIKNIPFVMGQNPDITNVGGAFGISTYWTEVNGSLVPNVLMPGYKDYLAYMKDLYEKSLIDKEFPANQSATVNEKFTSGRAGVMSLGWASVPTIMDALVKNKPEAKITFIQPLANKDGKAGTGVEILDYMYDGITVIPKASKNIEHTIKYLNLKLDDEIFKLYTIGEEGKHYTVKDGQYMPILPTLFDERGNANNFLTGTHAKYGQYWLARLRKDQRLYDAYQVMNTDFAKFHVPNPAGAAPALPESSKNSMVLDQLVNDFKVKVVTNSLPLSAIDDFIKDWKSKGGDANIKEINDWYKTYKK